ncbi:hypothetical protein [Cetobacterium sp.]|uniref:hypothetical protein n=1 Tax=Cetobacterium sp. TaxID=2071632 RepID=UPI003F3EBA8B
MKKIIIGIFSLFLLVSCGNSIKTYSKEEKQKMIELSDQNSKSKQELENILKDLKEKANKGNNKAESEYEEFMTLINSRVKIRQTTPIKL